MSGSRSYGGGFMSNGSMEGLCSTITSSQVNSQFSGKGNEAHIITSNTNNISETLTLTCKWISTHSVPSTRAPPSMQQSRYMPRSNLRSRIPEYAHKEKKKSFPVPPNLSLSLRSHPSCSLPSSLPSLSLLTFSSRIQYKLHPTPTTLLSSVSQYALA